MTFFSDEITNWYSLNKRDLPWRFNQDPYSVWLSEIVLQQTRVDQGLPYFLRLKERFPTVGDLARTDENDIFHLWQGLGYYSRAKNLHRCAQIIVEDFNGKFPTKYQDLLTLPGIGPYTAAAIASICFDEPVAVVDGNVLRLVSRFLGVDQPVNERKGLSIIRNFVNEEVKAAEPGIFNQAMMEMGSLVCKPKNPDCQTCCLAQTCYALKHKVQDHLPLKTKKVKVKNLTINYFLLNRNDKIAIWKRPAKGIWANLHEFPNTEHYSANKSDNLICSVSHLLTHRRIESKLWKVKTLPSHISQNNLIFEVSLDELQKRYPVHQLMNKLIKKWQDQLIK